MPSLAPDPTPTENLQSAVAKLLRLADQLDKKPLNARATVDPDITPEGTTVDFHWDPVPGSTAYIVGRDGTDVRKGGPIAFIEGRETTSRTFIWLTPSTTTLFVLALPSGISQAVPVTIGA